MVIPMKCGFRDCFQVNGSVWSHYCKLAYGKYKNKQVTAYSNNVLWVFKKAKNWL